MGYGIMSKFLEIKGLTQRFISNSEEHVAYKDINVSLDKGEFLSILGPSGCGKTTILKTIGGFLDPTSGRVEINGKEILEPGKHCAMVFQTFDQLFPWKTVIDNVVYPLIVNKRFKSTRDAERHALKYLEMVGLTKFKNYYPNNLSGGMKQRVAIARALALEPELILMDEPFASLDADTRTMLQSLLKRIWHDSGITVLFVTHSIMEAIALSTKFMVMGDQEKSIKLFEDNFVKGKPGKLNTPEDFRYSDTWSKLSRIIRGSKENEV